MYSNTSMNFIFNYKHYMYALAFSNRCEMNIWAGAWFWFTVVRFFIVVCFIQSTSMEFIFNSNKHQMTTVGYGSTAPTSDGGRAMVFTLGFLSIVIFAGVNIKAGGILSAIVDDVAVRSHLSRHVTRPWVFAVLWGVLYYMWMCVIAR